MSLKEQLVEVIQSQGYDLLTACELADTIIREIKADNLKQATYFIKNQNEYFSSIAITIKNNRISE